MRTKALSEPAWLKLATTTWTLAAGGVAANVPGWRTWPRCAAIHSSQNGTMPTWRTVHCRGITLQLEEHRKLAPTWAGGEGSPHLGARRGLGAPLARTYSHIHVASNTRLCVWVHVCAGRFQGHPRNVASVEPLVHEPPAPRFSRWHGPCAAGSPPHNSRPLGGVHAQPL